ncbi:MULTISPECIES: FliH/SctL family protein [Microbacterium]|uniref:FliH/SctL family protein n=1 Tax=Microbacterium TaxID=33882 RepID=UPI0006F293E6|nr:MULTISPECIES: FliH/SctL family protein [Microbacterium]KQZ25053.1 hypothetical protein ASD43_12365 [Microbacterium sp. Root553]
MSIVLDSAFTPLAVPRVGETPIDIRGEADRARTRGYADGFAEGRRIALDAAEHEQGLQWQRMQELRESYLHQRGSALAALDAARAEYLRRVDEVSALSADRLEELAVDLARVILGVELSDAARSAAHALRRALAEVPVDRWTGVTFSTRDLQTLQDDEPPALQRIPATASDTVDAGGAIVRVEDGAVDTRVAGALARASSALRGDDDLEAIA